MNGKRKKKPNKGKKPIRAKLKELDAEVAKKIEEEARERKRKSKPAF